MSARLFNPYTSIKTNLLFFTKGGPTKTVWFYEHPYPAGAKSYSKTKPLRIEEFGDAAQVALRPVKPAACGRTAPELASERKDAVRRRADAPMAPRTESRLLHRLRPQRAVLEQAERDARQAQFMAEWDADKALRAQVKRKAEEMRAAFLFVHMDEYTAGQALGLKGFAAGRKLRELVQCGLLRQFESPREPVAMMSIDGLREVEAPYPLCFGGPFYLREDILGLRREAAEVARQSLTHAPEPVRAEAAVTPKKDLVAELLQFVIDNSRRP